ncbi:hypothetical protein LCGC14_2285140 [marine sediment metagenome]|uniref:Uncharacterized protein n=1 Tax=marine sediment metagenome TaxID=412755 RepID=A0A0F9FN48_9ZZZZ
MALGVWGEAERREWALERARLLGSACEADEDRCDSILKTAEAFYDYISKPFTEVTRGRSSDLG